MAQMFKKHYMRSLLVEPQYRMLLIYTVYYFWNNALYWMVRVLFQIPYRVWVLHFSLVTVVIRPILDFFLLSTKSINQRTYLQKYRMFWYCCLSYFQPWVNDPVILVIIYKLQINYLKWAYFCLEFETRACGAGQSIK